MGQLLELVALMIPDLEENTRILQRKIDLLKVKKVDVDEKLQNPAYHSGKKRKREVEEWSNNAENIITEFESLEQQVQQRTRIYHVFARQQLAEQVERMTKEVTELIEQSDFPRGLFLDVDGNNGQLLLTQANGQAFLQNLNDIYMSLMEDDILSIGIYGMGGVGKTTLVMRAHDKLLTESRFSSQVYWVTVSQEFSIYKLQSDIAQALHLDFSCGSDEKKRAAQLFQEFKKRGRFVLILDDVWKQFDTGKIGIPFKRDGCRLVITSRSEEVCKRMYCDKIIKVNTLFEQEALDLFMKTLDRDDLSLEVKEICKKMATRCGGLPLALITLAGSMRAVNDIREWRDASERLKESCIGPPDMEDEVLPILLCSYNRLRDTKLKNCFLYCCLYPEDFFIPTNELIEKFISEEMMESRLNLQAEIDQGHAILNQLVRACLLERCFDDSVKMHDLIREMAIGIAKDKPRYMVKARLDLKELPEEQKWTDDLDKVSLMYNPIGDISPGTSPKCPRLSTLILRHNFYLHLIPDCFFTQMCGLRTLDLSFSQIRCLPNSISDLEKLNALLLHCCLELESVPSLDKLKQLRHLNLTGTKIEEVPQGMESLTNLKRLCFNCPSLKMIPTGTLHRLSHLQLLILPIHLEVPVEEVEALKQLEVFQGRLGSICDLKRLSKSRRSDKRLFSYRILISNRKSSADLGKAIAMESSLAMESFFGMYENMLPQNIESLFFFSRSGLSDCFLDEFPILNYFRDIKECIIEKEDKMESIMSLPLSADEDQQSSGVPFQSLEKLTLLDLPNFIGLFKWEAFAPLPPGTFSCLEELSIEGCGKIKKLFLRSLVHNFHNLKSLIVQDCVQMQEIIEDINNEGADITLPWLHYLSLVNLPQLEYICNGKMTPSSANEQQQSSGVPFQSREILDLVNLPNFIGLFNWEVVAPLPPGTFYCLKTLRIEGCDKIKKLFPRSLVHNFHNLQFLCVENCVQVEEIIEDINNEGADITLPRLRFLYLYNMPQLKSICKGKMICDSIEFISLRGIKNIKKFPLHLPLLHGQLSSPPYLRTIELRREEEQWWKSLEWGHHNANNVLEHLFHYLS